MSKFTRFISAFIILFCFGFFYFGQEAQAQFSNNSFGNISISADNAEYLGERTILTGGVDVRQAQDRLLADKVIIITTPGGSLDNNGIERIIAEGNFYYITPEQNVRGEKGIYTRNTDSFEVTGNVILKQKDGNIITGDKLYYNLTTKHARVVGTCKGRKCGSKGRVNILIKNRQSNTQTGTG